MIRCEGLRVLTAGSHVPSSDHRVTPLEWAHFCWPDRRLSRWRASMDMQTRGLRWERNEFTQLSRYSQRFTG